jgi:hypothetical protein
MIATPYVVTNLANIPDHTPLIFNIPDPRRELDMLIRMGGDESTIKSLIGAGYRPTFTPSWARELVEIATVYDDRPPSYGYNIEDYDNVLDSLYEINLSTRNEQQRDELIACIKSGSRLVPSVFDLHPLICYRLFKLAAMYLAYDVMDALHFEVSNTEYHEDDMRTIHSIIRRMDKIYDIV